MKETTSEKFREILTRFDTATLATVDAAGRIHARPMAVFEIEADGNVIFITDKESAKVHEIEKNPQATVIFQDGWKLSATVSGHATLFHDLPRLREHWRKTFQAWFPGGPDDSRIILVRVTGEQGEFWDNSGVNAFRYIYSAAKAVVTGTRPDIDQKDQHGQVTMNRR